MHYTLLAVQAVFISSHGIVDGLFAPGFGVIFIAEISEV